MILRTFNDLQYKMFLLNTTDVWVYKFDFVFTIQNVSIKQIIKRKKKC